MKVNSAVASNQTTTEILALRLHAYCVLQLCRMALEEVAHGRSQGAMPDQLKQALPQLVCSYVVLSSRDSHDAAAHVGSVWSTGQSQACNVWSHDAVQVAINLCVADQNMVVMLLLGAASTVKAFLHSNVKSGSVATPAEFCALFMLSKALLTHQSLRRVLLENKQAIRDATAIMTQVADLPGTVTSDMACSAALQQVRYAVQDLLN